MVMDIPTTMINLPEGQEWIMDMVNNVLIEVMASIAEQERRMMNIPPQTGQQNGGNRSRVTVEMSPGVRLQVQAVE